MSAAEKKEVEAALRRLGARRARHKDEGDAIREAIKEAVAEARGVVSMERAADLIGIHRGTIYELFMPDGQPAE